MFDFDTLEDQEGLVSAAAEKPTKEEEEEDDQAALENQQRAAALHSTVRQRVKSREPASHVLQKWEKCEEAKDLIRHFSLEDSIGSAQSIRLGELLRLLEALAWSSDQLVSFFLGEDIVAENADDLALDLLRAFAGTEADARGSVCFRCVFRLMEVLGCGIRRFLDELADLTYVENPAPAATVLLGSYRMLRGIGTGFNGMCIYSGEHVGTRQPVAIKYPVGAEELEVLKEINRQHPPQFLCLPQLLAHGTHHGELYAVTELLGSPITKIMERLLEREFDVRWQVMQVVGRLVLRRLQALHGCGFVHCDVSPENVLLGPVRADGEASAALTSKVAPYLIDFGLAQRHPGGRPLGCDHGSAEWNSVRSAAGGIRRPEDDLEALGWLLLNGLFGELPWFHGLGQAYERWDYSRVGRANAIKTVQECKLRLLNNGWGSLGGDWAVLESIPAELDRYMQSCRSDRVTGRRPDYESLSKLLGGETSQTGSVAEQSDLAALQTILDELV